MMYLTQKEYEPRVQEIIADFLIEIPEKNGLELKRNAIKNWAELKEAYLLRMDIRENIYIPHWREVKENVLFRWMSNFVRHKRSNYDSIVWRLIHYPSRWDVSEDLKAQCDRHLSYWLQTH